jgi:hypothetical protein
VFIALGAMIAAFAIGWAIAIRYAKTHAHSGELQRIPPPTAHAEAIRGGIHIPINVGTIQQNAEQKAEKAVQAKVERQFAPPHMEFVNGTTAPQGMDNYGCLKRVTSYEGAATSILARFYYKPEVNVPPSIDVKAHISIANSLGTPLKTRYDGTWEGECDTEYMSFGTAETHALLVALVPPLDADESKEIVTWGFGLSKDGFQPDTAILEGNDFLLTVDLVGKYFNDVVLQASFNLKLNVKRRVFDLAD